MNNQSKTLYAYLPCEARTACEPQWKGLVRLLLMLGVLTFYAYAL
jgi:hypothetical protein